MVDQAFGPQQRALLSGPATALFERALSEQGLAVDDPAIAPGAEEHDAFALLVEVGLLNADPVDGRHRPVDPSTVASRIVAPMGQYGAELLKESSDWAAAFEELSLTWRRSPARDAGPLTELNGAQQIDRFLQAAVGDAASELLTAQPQVGRNRKPLEAAGARDINALRRGVSLRTLYQHSARRSTPTREYVHAVTLQGAEVRTLDEFFNRIVIVDRRLAVIPAGDEWFRAVAIRDENLVKYLVDVFERSWERAQPFTGGESAMSKDVANAQRVATVRMLVEGHADATAAKRLGVSPRTYAGYIAALKDEYDAETRFQLGYLMGREAPQEQE